MLCSLSAHKPCIFIMPKPTSPIITISVVSHGQAHLVNQLLQDLDRLYDGSFNVIITFNIPENDIDFSVFRFITQIVKNQTPRGFGANHNAAFRQCQTSFFCVINPDIHLKSNPFSALLACMRDENPAVATPAVLTPEGEAEDNVRHFPTFFGLVAKALNLDDGRYTVNPGAAPFAADWVGGMFMLFRATDFSAVGGFDEGFFLYYEDVDICTRLWKSGRRVVACPQASVVHDARRASRRNLRYMRWHLSSMGRYFRKHLFRLPTVR